MFRQRAARRAQRGLFAIALIVVGLLMSGGATAAAAELQDAACLPSSTVYHQPTNGTRLAETFTALHTGALTHAQFSVYKESTSTGDYVLDVRTLAGSSVPTDNVLASTTVLNASVPDGQSLISNTFSAPASVVAGQRYALGVSRPGGSQIAIEVLTNPCPDSQLFSSPGSGSPWTMPNGGAWDARFAVFITPPVPTTATTPSGQRDAAVKRCKKKFGHDKAKRRKCRRKANLLPV
jgi:hypothetical protein